MFRKYPYGVFCQFSIEALDIPEGTIVYEQATPRATGTRGPLSTGEYNTVFESNVPRRSLIDNRGASHMVLRREHGTSGLFNWTRHPIAKSCISLPTLHFVVTTLNLKANDNLANKNDRVRFLAASCFSAV